MTEKSSIFIVFHYYNNLFKIHGITKNPAPTVVDWNTWLNWSFDKFRIKAFSYKADSIHSRSSLDFGMTGSLAPVGIFRVASAEIAVRIFPSFLASTIGPRAFNLWIDINFCQSLINLHAVADFWIYFSFLNFLENILHRTCSKMPLKSTTGGQLL